MITSVVREHHWTPDVINGLYYDDADHYSLGYWFDDVEATYKQK